MTLRDRCTPQKLNAHAVLDLARAGVDVPAAFIVLALAILGDLYGNHDR